VVRQGEHRRTIVCRGCPGAWAASMNFSTPNDSMVFTAEIPHPREGRATQCTFQGKVLVGIGIGFTRDLKSP
jgi:hypothetical protein